MGILASLSLAEVQQRGSIKDGDVVRLRRAYDDDHTISAEEAEALIALNEACPIKDPSWAEFFIEALTDYIVYQVKPEGYVVADNAKWLVDHIGRDGRIDSHTELELLVTVLDRARWSPPSLARFALEQVEQAVISGHGPLRSSQSAGPGAITVAEVALLRRILYVFAGDGGIAVTRAEADVLIAINRRLVAAKCPPAWAELYVKAVGNAVLAGLGYVVPSREEALRVEAWLDDADPRSATALLGDSFGLAPAASSARDRIGTVFSHMLGGAGNVWASLRAQSPEERALTRLERQRLEIIANERIDDIEETWLLERFGGDRPLDQTEMALFAFLQREASTLPPSVRELAARAMVAA